MEDNGEGCKDEMEKMTISFTFAIGLFSVLIISKLCSTAPIIYTTTESGKISLDPIRSSLDPAGDNSTALSNATFLGYGSRIPFFTETLGEDLDITCFAPGPYLLPPAHPADCLRAAQGLVPSSKAEAPFHWSTDKGAGIHLPEHWAHGSCRIEIVPAVAGDVDDVFSPAYLAQAVAEIVRPCIVNDKNRLGGTAIVGPQQVVRLLVRGDFGVATN